MEELQFLDALNERGTVYLIRQPATGRMLTGRRITPAQRQVYQALQGAAIPHVAPVREIRPEGDGQFLVLQDYLPGRTLEQRLEQGTLPAGEAADLGAQLCEALDSLHHRGIIHRDIKPANVLVGEDGTAWLIDFDIARTAKPTGGQDTALLGTPGYAAPEQFGFQQTDARADLFALGVLLNQLVTGELPQQRLAPPPLGEIVRRCTRMDPGQRYRDAAELQRDLLGLLPPDRRKTALGYLAAALVVAALLSTAGSPAGVALWVCLALVPVGWCLLALDAGGLRSRLAPARRFRTAGGRVAYCLGLGEVWAILCLVAAFCAIVLLS